MNGPNLIVNINENYEFSRQEVKILITGDLFPGTRVERFLLGSTLKNRNYQDINKKLLQNDICITNLESPLTNCSLPIIKSGPHLRASPDCARGIKELGFDVVSLANNHILDMGEAGLRDTIKVCNFEGLKVLGAGLNLAEASKPLVIINQGVSISIIGITEREFSIAKRSSAGACSLDLINNYSQIQDARKKTDFVLVLLHGGSEYYPLPSPRTQQVCRFFVESGANAVVCNHIHVPSGYEIYQGSPIVYSTGNFLFDWLSPLSVEWNQGYMVGLKIKTGEVLQMTLTPYWQCKDEIGLSFMSNEDAIIFFEEIKKRSEIIKNESMLNQYWIKYCQSKKNEYLSAILDLTKVERLILKMGLWPQWKIRRKSVPSILNKLRCESHLDILQNILESEL